MERRLFCFKCFGVGLVFAFLCVGVFCSCSFNEPDFLRRESVCFELPQWPPAYGNPNEYPMLSKWIIRISSTDSTEILEVPFEKGVENENESLRCFWRRFLRNKFYAVTAVPVTFMNDGNEYLFFKQAGTIYPSEFKRSKNGFCERFTVGKVPLKWETGFSAFLLEKMFLAGTYAGYSGEETDGFIQMYNWWKLQDCIYQKILESELKNVVFNPWLLDESLVCESIGTKDFSLGVLNPKNVFLVELEKPESFLSSYIPENDFIEKYSQLTLKKNEENLFSVYNRFGKVFKGTSVKNISIDTVLLPIFNDEYEKN